MKLVTYRKNGHIGVGLVSADLKTVTPFDLPLEKREQGALPIIEALAAGAGLPKTLAAIALSEVQIIAPIAQADAAIFFASAKTTSPMPKSLLAAALTAAQRRATFRRCRFTSQKCLSRSSGLMRRLRFPAGVSDAIDYEVELAVIIGTGGKGITKADAMKHVWGYTIINDVTARDWQSRHSQWLLGQILRHLLPDGPVVGQCR